jgi:hypothetical protein
VPELRQAGTRRRPNAKDLGISSFTPFQVAQVKGCGNLMITELKLFSFKIFYFSWVDYLPLQIR